MFNQTQERKDEELRFYAAIHGVKVDKDEKRDTFKFRDPKEYEHLSTEEKKELTAKMKEGHMGWAAGARKGSIK